MGDEMKMLSVRHLLVMVMSILCMQGASAAPAVSLTYGLFLKKLSVNFKESTFHAEFYWWLRFSNDSAVSGIPDADILNLEYVNGVDVPVGALKEEIQFTRTEGHDHLITGFHQGEFYFNADFSMYPFDKQYLPITVENAVLDSKALVFISDMASYRVSGQDPAMFAISTDLLKNTKSASYKIYGSNVFVNNGLYNTNFGDMTASPSSSYSRVNVVTMIDRSFLPYISKLIIPIVIILLLVYFVFFLPAEKLDIAAGLTVTSLLSAIAFQTAISGDIPEIGYITYVDKVFYTCYALIAIAMAESIVTFYMDARQTERDVRLAERVDYWFRFLFPVTFAASTIYFAR